MRAVEAVRGGVGRETREGGVVEEVNWRAR